MEIDFRISRWKFTANFQPIKSDRAGARWIGLSLKLTQVALSYGADYLAGTIVVEQFSRMAGAQTPQLTAQAELVKAIREPGREPELRGTFYEPMGIGQRTSLPAIVGGCSVAA